MTYNGWKNKETWLVNVWYVDSIAEMLFEESRDRRELIETDHSDLRDRVTYIAEECEALSQLPAGLLSDFISTCWAEVDWCDLADHINLGLSDRWAEEMRDA